MGSKIAENLAFEAYQKNQSLPEKYQISDSFWMDWFCKGFSAGQEFNQWHSLEENKDDFPESGRFIIVIMTDGLYATRFDSNYWLQVPQARAIRKWKYIE